MQARSYLKTLKHTGSVGYYIKNFTDLLFQVPDMSEGDLLFNFISNLSLWVKQQLQNPQGLATAISVAESLMSSRTLANQKAATQTRRVATVKVWWAGEFHNQSQSPKENSH